jgi:hypothetical protein
MQILETTRSLFVFWEDLVFLEAALMALPETTEFAQPVTAHLEAFETALKLDMDTLLDDGIRKLHRAAVFVLSDKATFKMLFSSSLSNTIRFALGRQVQKAEDLIGALSLSPFEGQLREEHVPALTALVERGKQALTTRKQTSLTRAEARIDIQDWKQSANAVRLAVYSELLKHTTEHTLQRVWAESFFKPYRRSRTPADSVEDSADTPTLDSPTE